MPQPPPGSFLDIFAGALGVAAAALLVGGWFLLRWQQGRHQFQITKALIDRGITRLSGGPPFWLLSMRSGLSVLVLGLGLTGVGAAPWWLGSRVEMPAVASSPPPQQIPSDVPPDRGRPDRRTEPRPGPREEGRPLQPDDDRPYGFSSQPPPRRQPPAPNPAMEQWHRAQAQETVGMILVGSGIVLVLLGLFRVAFATVERAQVVEPPASSDYP